jgi:hypothetical protein
MINPPLTISNTGNHVICIFLESMWCIQVNERRVQWGKVIVFVKTLEDWKVYIGNGFL